ncbi:SPT3 Dosage dependent suppressor of Ty-induced promoter mutations-like protein [Pichia californica]|nr:SPT3 Dosage dependent suppressor of Ty-induced promoter mutations-like protein [[Candida] californica]
MDTFMTFISNGAYPNKKDQERDFTEENSNTTKSINNKQSLAIDFSSDINMDNDEISQQILDDDVLNEFLNPNCFQQQTDNNNNNNINTNTNNNNSILDFIDNSGGDNILFTNQDSNNNIKNNNLTIENINSNNSISLNSPLQIIQVEDSLSFNPSDDLRRYENSKKELMKVKFGLNKESKYVYHSNVGFPYTKAPVVNNAEDPEVTTTLLPLDYQESFLKNDSEFDYQIKIEDLPKHSRVETQIKLDITISPPPPQFLLHIPRDSITKPKFTLADNDINDSIKEHLLYLDIFVVGSQTSHTKDGPVRSCNVCKRCMRRELKRASRRKAGLVDDSSNWDINLPKRAIIINSKEIVSFPAPNGSINEKKIELLSRIVCYCRHHQELEGFQILIFLKNKNGKIIGKTISTPILIMDRKKSLKSNNNINNNINNINEKVSESISNTETPSDLFTKFSYMNKKNSPITSNNSNEGSSNELSVSTTTPSINDTNNKNKNKGINNHNIDNNKNTISITTASTSNNSNNINNTSMKNISALSSVSVTNLNSMNVLPNSTKPQSGVFSSLFSFDPSNLLGDENSRQIKRQKRPWSPSESNNYVENINQKRIPSSNNVHNIGNISNSERKISIKKEPLSPMSSDAVSPQNHLFSSATSAFSTTPEKEYHEASSTISPANNNINSINIETPIANNVNQSMLQSDINNNSNDNMEFDLINNINMNINVGTKINSSIEEYPTIRRIIPAQGPIRGGIEITLLGTNFRPGLIVKFGRNVALATQCWSDSTIVTYLPPASQAGPVLVTFEDSNYDFTNSSAHQIFTYTDDTDRQLIELALQIVGLKMNGKLEDAKNIAKRIVGSNQMDSTQSSQQSQTSPNSIMNYNYNYNNNNISNSSVEQLNQQLQLNWMAVASNKIKELSKSTLNHEEILIKFLSMIKTPNSLISIPNWAVCNFEGQTMLHLACLQNYSKLCQFLIKNGSRIDYKDNNGFTPIHFAFITGNRKLINLLNKFKANISNKLDNGVLLTDIADSNVLDLIHSNNRRSSTSSSDVNFDDDDDYDFNDNNNNNNSEDDRDISIDEVDTDLSYEMDNEFEELDDYQLSYRSQHRHKNKKRYVHDSEFEADNEDDDSISDKIQLVEKKNGNKNDIKKETNSFGFNLWVEMKEAIKNKMIEFSSTKINKKTKNKTRDHQIIKDSEDHVDCEVLDNEGVEEEEQDDDDNSEGESEEMLPSYDDLFPHSSLRSFINFRGHVDDDQDQSVKKRSQQQQQQQHIQFIGGSAAGLSATLAIARTYASVICIDAGKPCNIYAKESHNFITHDSESPVSIRSKAREQIEKYPTAQIIDNEVVSITKNNQLFKVYTKSDNIIYQGKNIILAVGLNDNIETSNIKNLSQFWGNSIFTCGYCHGFEFYGKRAGLLLSNENFFKQMIPVVYNWNKNLTVFGNKSNIEQSFSIEELEKRGDNSEIKSVILENGEKVELDVLYYVPDSVINMKDIVIKLGVELDGMGLIKVEKSNQSTNVPGVYAAGDCTTMIRSLANATQSGQWAGVSITHKLFFDNWSSH